jgi:RNA polymerase sigma-70 factor (ECF subfamily)
MGASDAELIAAVLGGQVEQYTPLVTRHYESCRRIAYRMLANHADVDEALQGAFLRAFRALGQCEDPERFGAWLRQIVANECRTFGTRRGRRERHYADDDSALALQSTAPTVDRDALREEIEHALGQLDTTYREAFVMKYVEELSYEEMAEITGAGVSALKMRVKRACEQLRRLLEGASHA